MSWPFNSMPDDFDPNIHDAEYWGDDEEYWEDYESWEDEEGER